MTKALLTIVALATLAAGCSSSGTSTDGPFGGDVGTVCHDGYAFAVYGGFREGGLTRFPEADGGCEQP